MMRESAAIVFVFVLMIMFAFASGPFGWLTGIWLIYAMFMVASGKAEDLEGKKAVTFTLITIGSLVFAFIGMYLQGRGLIVNPLGN